MVETKKMKCIIRKYRWLPCIEHIWRELESDVLPPFMQYDYAYQLWKDIINSIARCQFPIFYVVFSSNDKPILIAPLIKNKQKDTYQLWGDEEILNNGVVESVCENTVMNALRWHFMTEM